MSRLPAGTAGDAVVVELAKPYGRSLGPDGRRWGPRLAPTIEPPRPHVALAQRCSIGGDVAEWEDCEIDVEQAIDLATSHFDDDPEMQAALAVLGVEHEGDVEAIQFS
ncbi:MAG: hypothetical protein HYS27_24320 [Deltaproteobacteria bacterium]|nr:hypothetical protein [Deltaproteobacteria bacterium]